MSKDAPRGSKTAEDSGQTEQAALPDDTVGVIDSRNAVVKWVIGAAAVAVLAGGGIAAWNTSQRGGAPTEIAAAEMQVSAAPLAASSVAPVVVDPAANADVVPTTPSGPHVAESTSASSRPLRPPGKPRAEIVPEAVVGVTPVGLTAQENEVVVTAARRPVWTRTPNAQRLSAAYPARALERGREGEASIRCVVREGGALDCTRISEFPARAGFGNAALRIARGYRHAPQRWDGRDAVGTPVNLRVVFRIDDGDRRRG